MEGQFVMVFLVAFIPIIYGQHNVTMGKIVVDGATTIAKTDENYICMTIDYWPFNECSKIPCLWDGNASVLNLVRILAYLLLKKKKKRFCVVF